MLWNPLNDAAEYRQQAKDKRERGGNGVVLRTRGQHQAALDHQREAMTAWERAVYEARYTLKSQIEGEREHLWWRLSDMCWSGDVPF